MMETKYKVVGLDEDRPTLEEMQEFVGGRIELVYVDNGHFVVNEEGLLDGLPINLEASLEFWDVADFEMAPPLVGNVIFIEGGLD
jgi:hypothetical protein